LSPKAVTVNLMLIVPLTVLVTSSGVKESDTYVTVAPVLRNVTA